VCNEIEAAAPVDLPDLCHGIAAVEHLERDASLETGLNLYGPFGQVIGAFKINEGTDLPGLNGKGGIDQVDYDA